MFRSCPEGSQAQPESRTPPCGGPPAALACAFCCFTKPGPRTTRRTITTEVDPENEALPRALGVQASADGAQQSGVGKLPRDQGHSCWPVTAHRFPFWSGARACLSTPAILSRGSNNPTRVPVCLVSAPPPCTNQHRFTGVGRGLHRQDTDACNLHKSQHDPAGPTRLGSRTSTCNLLPLLFQKKSTPIEKTQWLQITKGAYLKLW